MKSMPESLALVALSTLTLLAATHGSAGPGGPRRAAREPAPTVLLVRHAETAESTESARDPALSEAGGRRAQALARLLSGAAVSHLFASEFERTQATLAPLAAEQAVELQVVAAGEADALVARLRELPPGAVAVVAGHSNTVPGLVAALGGQIEDLVEHPTHGRMLASTQYDRLFIVSPTSAQEGPILTLELRYGAP